MASTGNSKGAASPQPYEEDAAKSPSPPSPASGPACYRAWKTLIPNIASELAPASVASIRYTTNCPPAAANEEAVDVLWRLEMRGEFSYCNVEPLDRLLRGVNRHDLADRYLGEYRRQYGREIAECSTNAAGKFCKRI